jgi:predicted TPR repeat methyltransferase
MRTQTKYFPKAYGLKTQEDINNLYDDWAETYDVEVKENGYVSPARLASALKSFLAFDALIYDVGCGTGLSGVALKEMGFLNIHGSEINPNMLKKAQLTDAYQSLKIGDISNPFPDKVGAYDAIVAVGVIGAGAAPARLMREALNALLPGGLLAFSLNDAAMGQQSCQDELKFILNSGSAIELFSEYGPHLSSIDVGSTIYILKKI